MQLEEIQIPVYFGGFIDVFWDSDGIIRVDTERDRPVHLRKRSGIGGFGKAAAVFFVQQFPSSCSCAL